MNTQRGEILIVSGASGAGKTSLVDRLLKDFPGQFVRSRSTTTRKPRGEERHGVDYDFVSDELFQEMLNDGDFLEYAEVHGKRYGTSIDVVLEAVEARKIIVLTIDVQGHQLIRQSDDPRLDGVDITSVFINVDAVEVQRRLVARCDMTPEQIEARLRKAGDEIARRGEFDYVIENPRDGFEVGYKNFKCMLGLE